MAGRDNLIVLKDLRGGRNGADPPSTLDADQVLEALNVDFYRSPMGRKRGGAAAIAETGVTFTHPIGFLATHFPGSSGGWNATSELWAVDADSPINVARLAGGTTWATVTLKDAIAGNVPAMWAQSFNGKLFLAYNGGTENRLHVWDGSTVRRAGLGVPAAPTAADSGSGTPLTVTRSYKVQYTVQAGGVTTRRSEMSPVLTHVPGGSDDTVTVTKPTTISEGETHWELLGSDDPDGNYQIIATTVVGTTTFADTLEPAAYDGTAAENIGTNLPPPSVRWMIADDNRILMAGAWETTGGEVTPLTNRVWWTPVQGSADVGDDERIVITSAVKNYFDFEEEITGFAGPYEGGVIVFAWNRMWRLIPTGVVESPYVKFTVSNNIGCIVATTVVTAEDEAGNVALYWLSPRGPYRLGQGGLQYLGHDIEDIWATVNFESTIMPAHGEYYSAKKQIWWWVATGASNSPDTKLVFHVEHGRTTAQGDVRRGWSKHTGDSATTRASTMFSSSIGASMGSRKVPVVSTATKLLSLDNAATDDDGTDFQAYVESRPFEFAGLGRNFDVDQPSLLAEVSSGVTLTLTMNRDFGAQTRTSTVLLTASGSETHKQVKFEAAAMSDAGFVSFRVGDAAASDAVWKLVSLVIPVRGQQQR